jgi:multidrug efflux pump subunit AcrA (membrane-fusion protein)
MQIQDIVIYGKSEQKRVLTFKLGSVNIITGESKTGKSALIDIIDYCLGSDDCNVAVGKIRDNVEWFGLRLKFETEHVFIARQNPDFLKSKSTSQIYFETADFLEIPDFDKLKPNSTINALNSFLSNKLFISPNLHEPPPEQTCRPLEANFRHSLFFCFQEQGIIASKKLLFHKQDESFISQALKDILPYILGAIREDQLKLEQKLTQEQRELKRAENKLKEAQKISEEGISKAFALVEEAKEFSLLPSNCYPLKIEDAIKHLEKVNKYEIPEEKELEPTDERISELIDKQRELGLQLQEKQQEKKAAEAFAREAEGYTSESKQQELRLESLNLFFHGNPLTELCPVCLQKMKNPTPTASEINSSLDKLRSNLETTTRERPKLRAYINQLENDAQEIKKERDKVSETIKSIYQERESAKKLKDLNIRKGRVIGRISLFLEDIDLTDKFSDLNQAIRTLKEEIHELETLVEQGREEQRLDSILNTLNVQMSKWSEQLNLEYKDAAIRFDIKKLTIFIDTGKGEPIPLNKLGSGENWVSYHLLVHLALHRHFINTNRPVPRFLFLDQPSQVYYPPEKDVEFQGDVSKSSDEKAIHAMYNFIFDVTKSLFPNLQVLVTDHADLKTEDFAQSVLERWRDGKKLVPIDWYKS